MLELRAFHGCIEIKNLTSIMTKTTPGVEIAELKRSFAVVRSEVGVVTSQG